MDTESLWFSWRKCFCCDDRAIALAIKTCNKIVKQEKSKYKKNKFYLIKDEFIRRNDRNIVRYEKTIDGAECPKCKNVNPESCTLCNGDGFIIYYLYECQMDVAGLRFSLHSLLSPNEFTTKVRSTEEEHSHFHKYSELPNLSMDDLLQLLSYIVWHIWGLEINYDNEYPKIKSYGADSGDK